MFEIVQSTTFRQWIRRLRDREALERINARLRRVLLGNLGDVGPVGNGISEMRIQYGPEYRIYYILDGRTVIVLLCGGDRDSQSRDIERAKRLASEWRSGNA
jgi:putative addiction module killer protein